MQVRSRPYLVTRVQPPAPTRPGDDTLVTLSCLSDDGVNPWTTHDRFIISHALLHRRDAMRWTR